MEKRPPLHPGVVAIEKGAFGSPLTKGDNFTFTYICHNVFLSNNDNLNTIIWFNVIGLVGRVFANGSGELGSIPGLVIPKTLKMVLDTSLLNTQQYKLHIKGKVE